MKKSARSNIATAAGVFAVILAVWSFASSQRLINPVLLPSPAGVWSSAAGLISSGALLNDVVVSLERVVLGFALGAVVAIPLGLIMGLTPLANRIMTPIVEVLRPIPPIAWIPLVVMWLGIGQMSKVIVIADGAFFPILLNTFVGFSSVERIHLSAINTFGASRMQQFRYVYLPSAFRHIVLGLRLGVSMAFIVLVAAELIASNAGLGYLINDASQNFRPGQAIVGMITIGLVGYALNSILLGVEHKVVKWKEPA